MSGRTSLVVHWSSSVPAPWSQQSQGGLVNEGHPVHILWIIWCNQQFRWTVHGHCTDAKVIPAVSEAMCMGLTQECPNHRICTQIAMH